MTTHETVVITRDFTHPLSVIFRAFSTPEIVQKWLAPDGFSCSEVVQDLRVGGRMHTHFVDADGNSAISEGSYTMIVPNSVIPTSFGCNMARSSLRTSRRQSPLSPSKEERE